MNTPKHYIVKFTIFKSEYPDQKIEVKWKSFVNVQEKESWIAKMTKKVFENNKDFENHAAWSIYDYKYKEYNEYTILDCTVKELGDLSINDFIRFSNLYKKK